MSTPKVPPDGRKSAPANARPAPANARRTTPPSSRISTPVTPRPARRQGRDLFGLYFIGSVAVGILLFGVAVWTLRSLGAAPAPTPTPTSIPLTALPVGASDETPLPLSPVASPTPPAPDALTTGAFAPSSPITSVVITDSSQVREPMHLPAALPQAVLQLSDTAVFFGNVDTTSVLTRELTLANAGARDLDITELATSCVCVTAWVDAKKLPTGTRTHLIVTYHAALDPSEPGFTAGHTLSIGSTDGQNPLTKLTVSAVLP